MEDVKPEAIRKINSKIKLEEHREEWEEIYKLEGERIKKALGPRDIEIHHVGSTSIKDLMSKDLVDILLLVKDSSREEDYLEALLGLGYSLKIREEDWFQHRMFKYPSPEINLHVFSKGCKEAKRMLIFRDWLRENKEDRKAYENLKKELASKEWDYMQDYADQKTSLVEEILKRAFENS